MLENEEKKEKFTLQQFQRNRYFYGKLMTVRDFELEQEYFNGKRYLLNRLTHGKTLLCGFSNLKLFAGSSDEVSVWFGDGGVALDSMGREIIVPVDMKKKVLTKDGVPFKRPEFRSPTYLYLRYSPADSEPVRAASNPLSCDEITCPNRVMEDFEVIASFDYPVEKENESGSVSCTACEEADEKVFFVAVNEDLSINEKESLRRHYLQTRQEETVIRGTVTGVVHFKQPTVNSIISSFIDPKLGPGPISIQVGLETEDNQIITGYAGASKKNGYLNVQLGTILDPSSGKFCVKVVFEDERERNPIRVRWWASRADMRYGTEEVKSNVVLTKYRFASDPEVQAKFVENGLCESGAKNCMEDGKILGGDHYARIENDVALNGNPEILAELVKEQDEEPKNMFSEWEIGGGWRLTVENFYSTVTPHTAEIKLHFKKEELKKFKVSKGDLITYCEDIGGEKGVPLFVTYIDDIYIPRVKSLIGKEAKIVLKYTWAISKNIGSLKIGPLFKDQ
ncbi:MAG: hypothetical protein PHF18_05985 [Methanosarcina sp.]|uniref:hypothetical protein n=1 Tax=Methanosarcina sp. TaxID=2213 RepID=UPI0026029B98|nr:hypothetical protein [Methanosarcina sp.]MDD3246388.1 hypothetical protein [Methanosarcina sp.]MDD4248666.1 hypothetical protein [Methanosarcina sp.]